MKVTVLGAGLMGSALIKSLLANEHDVTVWNRTKEKALPLTEFGAQVVDTVEQALSGVDIVIGNLRDNKTTEAVLNTSHTAELLRGKTIVELASGAPKEAREAKQWVDKLGASYLDGAILATPDLIGTEEAAIVISGDLGLFEKVQPTLSAFGSAIHVGSEIGSANAIDVSSLSMMWGALFGAAHAVAVCEAEGVDLNVLGEFWKSSGPVVQFMVDDFISRNVDGRIEGDQKTLATVATHYGAMHHLESVMQDKGLDNSVLNGYKSIFAKADAAGKLTSDFAIISQFMKN
ncbi:hypothetical protein BSQ33_06420 [Vibrio gazogenes]|uniref:Uncharacterized protein n=2 Tax=Vibrio gazogenes TaxID=687 RepID=A0A1Z2SIX1_VIBGA|nr:hypothetical protein BSQ33_06420 [Vibrio gazogenes]